MKAGLFVPLAPGEEMEYTLVYVVDEGSDCKYIFTVLSTKSDGSRRKISDNTICRYQTVEKD